METTAVTPSPTPTTNAPLSEAEETGLREQIIKALRTCYDPEIPVNIYDMGLIYHIDIRADHSVKIDMTLTSPNCPAAQTLPADVERAARSVEVVREAEVEVVWDPPYHPSMMSEVAKIELGWLDE